MQTRKNQIEVQHPHDGLMKPLVMLVFTRRTGSSVCKFAFVKDLSSTHRAFLKDIQRGEPSPHAVLFAQLGATWFGEQPMRDSIVIPRGGYVGKIVCCTEPAYDFDS